MGITLIMNQKYNKKRFLNDERIVKAKELINEAVKDYQNQCINSIIGPQKQETQSYNTAKKLRGGGLFSHT